MKQQISPVVAGGIAAVVLIIVGIIIWRGTGVGTASSDKPPAMPPDVAAEFNRRMGGMPNAGGAPNVPGNSAPVNTGLPSGGSGAGYMAPPPPR